MEADFISLAALGPACAFMASVTWAIGTVGYSRLSRQYIGYAVNFARALAALPLFLIAAWVEIGSGPALVGAVGPELVGWMSLSMLASYALGDTLFYRSASILGVPAALAIASTYPMLTMLGGVVFLGDSVSTRQVIGLIATVAGVIGVILSREAEPSGETFAIESADAAVHVTRYAGTPRADASGARLGVLLAFGTAIFWALNGFAVSRGGVGVPGTVVNLLRMTLALPIIAAVARCLAPRKALVLPLSEFRRWAWLFVFEAFGGSMFYVYGLSHSPLVIGATLSSLAPVISMPIACCFGNESFSWSRALGVMMVVAGVWLLVGSS